jgi:hypothetical protein
MILGSRIENVKGLVPPARTCTCDQRVTKAPLYYLSYGDELVFRMGLEPI